MFCLILQRQFKPVKVQDTSEVKEAEGSEERETAVDFERADDRPDSEAHELDDVKPEDTQDGKSPVLTRIRRPVAYDDLFD